MPLLAHKPVASPFNNFGCVNHAEAHVHFCFRLHQQTQWLSLLVSGKMTCQYDIIDNTVEFPSSNTYACWKWLLLRGSV